MSSLKEAFKQTLKTIGKQTNYGRILEVIKSGKKAFETPGNFFGETPLGRSVQRQGWGKSLAEGFSEEARARQPEWMQVAQTIPIGYLSPQQITEQATKMILTDPKYAFNLLSKDTKEITKLANSVGLKSEDGLAIVKEIGNLFNTRFKEVLNALIELNF